MDGCSFQQFLRQNLCQFLSQHWKTLFLRGFIFKPTEKAQVLLKSGTRDLQNSPLFERSACFYVTISENFEHFQYFNFQTDFVENKNLFQKTVWSTVFQVNALRLKRHHFHTIIPYQKPMLRQINCNYKMGLPQRTEFCQ